MKILVALGCLPLFVLAGCAALPTAGPTNDTVIDQSKDEAGPRFAVVDIDDTVIQTLDSRPVESFHSRFGHYGLPAEATVSVGDVLSVSIWEAGGGSLFGQSSLDRTVATGSHPATIPEQVVMRDGAISVPFVGRIHVAGRSIIEVQNDIEHRLQGKAADPQVIVSVPKSITNTVTVSGEVVSGARVPISPGGDRLLDVIASAGGARAAVYDTFVRLSRDGVTATIPLENLVSDPAENIQAWPGDVVTLIKMQQSFDAFGAIGRNAHIPFEAERITLSQALAKAAGLLDERADPKGVFLLRSEPASLAAELTGSPAPVNSSARVPVAYHLDMSDAKAFFLAQRFPVDDGDVVYVANAKLDEVQKFFSLIGTLTSPVVSGVVVQNATR
jgi:polysaccharide export outer membrane protein